MISNLASADRLARIIFGFILAAAAIIWNEPYTSWILIIIGLVVLITGMVGRCPLYAIFKIDTKRSGGRCLH